MLLALTAGLVAAATPASGRAASTARAHSVDVIVQLAPGAGVEDARAAVRRHHGRVIAELHLIRALAARLPARRVAALRHERGLEVSVDARVLPSAINAKDLRTSYPYAANAPTVWNTGSDRAATGRGVGIAVIDTGIAGALPDFRTSGSDARSRIVGSAVTNPSATTAEDTYGHGTHVAGILAGNGNLRAPDDPLRAAYVGIAPEADLVSVKVSDDAGVATTLDVIYGLQFVVDHKDDYNIRVVNLSLESTAAQSATTDPLDAAAEATWFAGIAVVVSAGNRGTARDAVFHAPGNDPYVISVGAVDDGGSRSREDDFVTSWSSRGTTQDGHGKPDVYASGAHMVSALAPGSAFASLCAECVVSDSYFRAGGTSMSAPVVSGVLALVLDRRPNLSPDQLKTVVTRSARQLAGNVPAVDADAAVRYAGATSIPPANQGLTPSTLIDPATNGIDPTRSSWSRSSWSSAPPELAAQWARSSWSCNCSLTTSGEIDPTRSSWSRSSWSTSWTK